MKMKKVNLLPNIITAFGLSCGLFVIFKMTLVEGGKADYSVLLATAGILLLAALADLLDGAVARVIKAESDFGVQFDSLADAISFGVAPSVIVLKSISAEVGSELSFFMTTAATIFSVCGVLRLVRYNVTASKAKGHDELIEANKKNFTGLPIPAAAAAIVSGNLFLVSEEFQHLVSITHETLSYLMMAQLVVIGYFMISRWKFPSVKMLQIRVASFSLVFLTVLSAVVIFYGLLHHFALVFFISSWGYLLTAWVLSLIRLISGKKSKTLEDFEPEPEEELEDE